MGLLDFFKGAFATGANYPSKDNWNVQYEQQIADRDWQRNQQAAQQAFLNEMTSAQMAMKSLPPRGAWIEILVACKGIGTSVALRCGPFRGSGCLNDLVDVNWYPFASQVFGSLKSCIRRRYTEMRFNYLNVSRTAPCISFVQLLELEC